MLDDGREKRPPLGGFGDDVADHPLHRLAVGLVLEVRHGLATRRVIPNGAQETAGGSGLRIGHLGDERGSVDRLGPDTDPDRPAGYPISVHTILLMADTTGEVPQLDVEDETFVPDELPAVPEEHHAYAPPDGTLPAGPDTAEPAPPPMAPEPWRPVEAGHVPQSGPEEPGADRGIGVRTLVLIAVLAAVLGAALSGLVVALLLDGDDVPERVIERIETQIVPTRAEGLPTAAAVARRVLPSIVTVEVGAGQAGSFLADGSGSGVVVDAEQGLLVTNQHVVDGAGTVRVVFADGRGYDAEIVGEDALTDLAVIRIDAEGLTAVELGSAVGLEIGDTAIAIGSPLGLEGGPSVTVGVVSAFDRRVQTNGSELFGMLQTDAPITRGSSGGALVDTEGRLIGITTAIGVSDVGAEGLGFAIPVEMVTRITDELVETGTVQHAFLGIQGSTFFSDQPDGATVPAGVVVAMVIDGSAAQMAGIEAGDVIHLFDGTPVTTMEKLVVDLRFYRVGDVVGVEVDRGGETRSIDVTLLVRPEDT